MKKISHVFFCFLEIVFIPINHSIGRLNAKSVMRMKALKQILKPFPQSILLKWDLFCHEKTFSQNYFENEHHTFIIFEYFFPILLHKVYNYSLIIIFFINLVFCVIHMNFLLFRTMLRLFAFALYRKINEIVKNHIYHLIFITNLHCVCVYVCPKNWVLGISSPQRS